MTDLIPAPRPDAPDRREFLVAASGLVAAAGVAAAALPFVAALNPAADTLATGGPLDIDVGAMGPGQQIIVQWQGKPVFIARRGAEAVAGLAAPDLLAKLRDPDSLAHQQPDYARNPHRSLDPEFLVVIGICTHLGCVPGYKPAPGAGPVDNWSGGYHCACHGSLYDLAGRVFKNVPAPFNLPVPPHRFVDAKTLRIGENPPGSDFSLGGVEQL